MDKKQIIFLASEKLKVTQIGSSIGRTKDQEQTLRGLGPGKIRRSKILQNTPEIRGMIRKVAHLVTAEEIAGGAAAGAVVAGAAAGKVRAKKL